MLHSPFARTFGGILRTTLRPVILVTEIVISIAILAVHAPIPQALSYHQFADQHTLFGIPNFWNVISNAPFLLVGLWGIFLCVRRPAAFLSLSERWDYILLFVGVTLTCFGSGYYHWNPNNDTLVWDRLPMTIGFMGLLAATISERISIDLGRRLLIPLIAFGLFSVGYWHYTELAARGDLRPYILVQFGTLLLILTMTLLFPPLYSHAHWISATLAFYVLAKVCEDLDSQIYFHLGVSGHAIKHIAAAIAVVPIVFMLTIRSPLHRQ